MCFSRIQDEELLFLGILNVVDDCRTQYFLVVSSYDDEEMMYWRVDTVKRDRDETVIVEH